MKLRATASRCALKDRKGALHVLTLVTAVTHFSWKTAIRAAKEQDSIGLCKK